MKILYGITKSNFGGAQRYVFDLALEAKRRGHEVAVLCGGRGALVEKLEAEKIRVISIPGFGRDMDLLHDASRLWFIIKALSRERADVLHINSAKMGGAGIFAGRLLGVPRIIFTAHGWTFHEERPYWQKQIIAFFSWLTILGAHHTIVVSDADLAAVKSWPFVSDKVSRIYNGIDFNTQFGTGEIIRRGFPTGAHITGTIGELNKNKNHIALIEEARRNKNMYVAIVGEGENREFLVHNIKEYGLEDRVKLFGFLPREEALKGFDVFALPSLKEGLPYVLLEAKLAGIPIEANCVGGVSEILNQPLENFSLETMYAGTFAQY